MKNNNYAKHLIIEKIRQTKQGKRIPKLDEYPFEVIQEIHEARAKNLELSEEEFNKWIVSKNFYANGISLSVIAYILHTTSEWVRQLEKKAISKLRRPNLGGRLKKYKDICINTEISEL